MPSRSLLVPLLIVLATRPAHARNRTACDDVPERQGVLNKQGPAASRPLCSPTNADLDFEAQAKRFLPVHRELMTKADLPEDARRAVKSSYEMFRSAYDFLRSGRDQLCADRIDMAVLLRAVPETGASIRVPDLDAVDSAVKRHLALVADSLGRFELDFLGRKNGFDMKGRLGSAGTKAAEALNASFLDDQGARLLDEVKKNLPSGVLENNFSGDAYREPSGVFSAGVEAVSKDVNFFQSYSGASFELRHCAQVQSR